MNGRKFGRAASTGVAQAEVTVGGAAVILGIGAKTGGTAATVGTGGTGSVITIPVAVAGVGVEVIGGVAVADGVIALNNANNLSSLKMESSASENGGSGSGMTGHGSQRAAEAKAGDSHREVGDANKVVSQGRTFRDTETGNTVHVKGNRVVINNSKGERVTQFKNPKANTQERIQSGKWEPVSGD